MSKGVMPKQINKTKANAETYANHSNHELAGMISNTSEELQEEIRRLVKFIHHCNTWRQYQFIDEQQAMQEHLAQVQRAEEQVKNLSNVLAGYTNAFTSRIGKQ